MKLEQINNLAEEGDFRGAAVIADEIDWRHVKSARTLCMVGEIYEANKRYDDSRRVLKYAYKRSSSSKTVLYRLAELDIRTGNYDEAKKFINEFESNSPNDTSRHILKYKLLRATKAPLDDQIEVLKEYKDSEYTERWAYELAKLYKRNGQKEKCIEECDDMILWFSEGRYVVKAMELKMSLTELTPMQKARYETQKAKLLEEEEAPAPAPVPEPDAENAAIDPMVNVEKTILAADEEDEDVHTEVSASEAIEKMDTAAGRFNGGEVDTKQEKKEQPVSLSDRLTNSIRNIFSGMRLEKEPDEDEDMKIVPEASEETEEAAAEPETAEAEVEKEALADVFAYAKQAAMEQKQAALETEQTGEAVETEETEKAAEEAPAPEAPAPETPVKEELPMKDGEVDFEKLFAETGSALAGEVASGNYVMADTLEEDLEEAEAAAEIIRNNADAQNEPSEEELAARREAELIGRETDESLGLTREFHFSKEEMARPAVTEEEKTPIEDPEVAARRAVYEEQGISGEEIPETPAEVEESSVSEADEELMAAFAGDMEIPEEEQTLMSLAGIGEAEEETESDTLIKDVMGESGVFTTIPVEGRELTGPEKSVLSYFAAIPGIDSQTTAALADIHNNCGDKTSKSGNIVIMGRQGSGKTRLADGLILMTCLHLGIKAAKVGKIVADSLNGKDPAAVVRKMSGGFLIIEGAGALSEETIDRLNQAMEFRTDDLVVILEDERDDVKKMLDTHPDFAAKFTSRITVPVFTNDELVTFARVYAAEEGYKFDELSTLTLYSIIGENQKSGEPVTVGRVREIVDRAIDRNHRKLFGKITDREDGMQVLVEKDFK
ncbi:MAG: tetratricopeptide repeat protein [Lachnospiraceae bacterium]|nr:tetratricopeptide repeat protein [Lachnospiraceae bacterium]